MGSRSNALADQFEQAIDGLIATIERCTDADLKKKCGEENWTVAGAAHHVGVQFPLEFEYLSAAAEKRALPDYTWDYINQLNDARAQANSASPKEEAIRQLRFGRAMLAPWIRSLSDEQLDHASPLKLAEGANVTLQQLLEGGVLIDHARAHAKSIQSVM